MDCNRKYLCKESTLVISGRLLSSLNMPVGSNFQGLWIVFNDLWTPYEFIFCPQLQQVCGWQSVLTRRKATHIRSSLLFMNVRIFGDGIAFSHAPDFGCCAANNFVWSWGDRGCNFNVDEVSISLIVKVRWVIVWI